MSLRTGYHYRGKSAHIFYFGKGDATVPLVVEHLPITEYTLTKTDEVIVKLGSREATSVVLVDANNFRIKYQRGYCMLIAQVENHLTFLGFVLGYWIAEGTEDGSGAGVHYQGAG